MSGSITFLVDRVSQGDDRAVQPLWDRFFMQMVRVARTRVGGLAYGEEEDAALSAFDHFCRRAASDGFKQMANRDDLWQVLQMLTRRKAIDRLRHASRQKRCGAVVSLEGDVAATTLDPRETVMESEELRILFDRLEDPELQEIAAMKMESHTNEEIARHLGCTVRTVGRRLELIRSIWQSELE